MIRGVVMTIPSPSQAVWYIGPLPLRAYALCILIGIVLAVWITSRRWQARGGRDGGVLDVAAYAVPSGIVGARLYHVATSWQPYFGESGRPLDALKIWEGGLGIWGAVAGGALGAYVACRRLDLPFVVFADSAAPGLAVGQAVGRIGNWFNNELYGARTDLPWGLQIHPWDSSTGRAVRSADGIPELLPGAYHPTFLYEALWCLLVAAAVVLLDRRHQLDHGRSLALYVMLYTAGRLVIETLRIDESNIVLGRRLNEWTSVLVFVAAAVGYFMSSRRNRQPSQDADGVSEKRDV